MSTSSAWREVGGVCWTLAIWGALLGGGGLLGIAIGLAIVGLAGRL